MSEIANQQILDDVATLRDRFGRASDRPFYFMAKQDHIRLCWEDGTVIGGNKPPYEALAGMGYRCTGVNFAGRFLAFERL